MYKYNINKCICYSNIKWKREISIKDLSSNYFLNLTHAILSKAIYKCLMYTMYIVYIYLVYIVSHVFALSKYDRRNAPTWFWRVPEITEYRVDVNLVKRRRHHAVLESIFRMWRRASQNIYSCLMCTIRGWCICGMVRERKWGINWVRERKSEK